MWTNEAARLTSQTSNELDDASSRIGILIGGVDFWLGGTGRSTFCSILVWYCLFFHVLSHPSRCLFWVRWDMNLSKSSRFILDQTKVLGLKVNSLRSWGMKSGLSSCVSHLLNIVPYGTIGHMSVPVGPASPPASPKVWNCIFFII